MHYGLTEEQRALQQAVREIVADLARPRERYDEEHPLDAPTPSEKSVWDALVSSGIAAIGVPESLGGPGGGCIEQALVAEELGRGLASTPYLSVATATAALDVLPALADVIVAGRWTSVLLPSARASSVTHDGTTLSGRAPLVPDAASAAGALIVVPGSVLYIDETDLRSRVTSQPTLDRTRALGAVELDGLLAQPVTETAEQAAALADRLAARRRVVLAAESTGVAAWCLDTTSTFTVTRQQFGVPIGTFQAVKHRLADMLVLTENARSATWGAAWALEHGWSGWLTSSLLAKAVATEAAASVAGSAVQLHGGIGVTWEHDLHLYLRRAKSNEQLDGPPSQDFVAMADKLLPC